MESEDREEALRRLEPFVGEWTVEAALPGSDPNDRTGRSSFEWALDGQYLLQRTSVPIEGAPDSISIYRVDLETGAYQQHYFDTRGVVRVYEMALEDGVWRLERHEADFSPLPFHQRYVGAFSDDGSKIEGAWERSDSGEEWEVDFPLEYVRIT